MNQKKIALIVGYGSVGIRHAKELLKNNFKIMICDKNEILKKKFDKEKTFYTNINKIKPKELKKISLAIISTWGPSHFQIFSYLCYNGIKKIIMEKPLCTSHEEADKILLLSKKFNVDFIVHHRWVYDGTHNRIKKILKDHNEKLLSIIIHGGATCLITSGAHYVKLATDLFNSFPIEIISDVKNSKINPRSKSLGYWDGFVKYKFSEGKYLMHITNNSSRFRDEVYFYSKKLLIRLHNNNLHYSYIKNDLKITRTENSDFKFKIKLATVQINSYYNKMLKKLLNNKIGIKEKANSIKNIKTLISSLSAPKINKKIIPINNSKSIMYFKKWPIS